MPTQAQKRKTTNVNDNDKPVGKRSRVSRACDQCRTAREKCDGAQPVCLTCSSSHRACSYTTNPKKRGIQSGYIRALELSLTWLFQNLPDSEAALNKKLVQEGNSSILLGRDSKISNRLHKDWRRSRFCKDLDRLLSGGDVPHDDSKSDTEDQESDLEEETALSSHRYDTTESLLPPDLVDIDALVIPRGPSETLSPNTERTLRTSTDLPTNRWHLLDIFFSYTNCWLPICEKHDVLKTAYSYPEQGLALSSADSGDQAELWSIFALSSLQERCSNNTYSGPRTGLHTSVERYYDIARALVPSELGLYSLGHVKALLILSLVNLVQLSPNAAWLLVGYASRVLLSIEKIASVAQPRFRHVLAGCYLLDSVLSNHLKLRPYFSSQILDTIGKIPEDGIEEWQPWAACLPSGPARIQSASDGPIRSLSTFNAVLELIGIVNGSEKAGTSQEQYHRFEIWKNSLPSSLAYIRSDRDQTPLNPPAILLQILFYSSGLSVSPSETWYQKTLGLIGRCHESQGLAAIPPLLLSLLEGFAQHKLFDSLDRRLQVRFHGVQNEFLQASSSSAMNPQIIPLPDSFHIPSTATTMSVGNSRQQNNMERPQTSSTLLEDLLPDMSSTATNTFNAAGFQSFAASGFNAPQYANLKPPTFDPRNSVTSGDLESFFDELASLDGAEAFNNQPQFMQNLGFAPDANMTDLLSSEFGQFNPLISPYMNQPTNDPRTTEETQIFRGG
ncbi:hypothetical protein EJ04DRAFT_439860 [Polyplosphaeria fusca]|uniref:Zn(2)-C6 fungal-type domain-containing protein n=1 Tax=Polyplosphaeria fusca TaxID=682080 RepID=A0A9P4QSK9_9PLEO|nr:hypothetical protein EJ04DRAFT_439860 [Polyplosphaeria fusca]